MHRWLVPKENKPPQAGDDDDDRKPAARDLSASAPAKRKAPPELPSLDRRKPLSPLGNVPPATAAAVGASAKKPAEVSEEPAGYYGRSNSSILTAVTHTQAVLSRMTDAEVEAKGDHFFLQTSSGPILCVTMDSEFFANVQLRCFREQMGKLRNKGAYAPIFPVQVPKKGKSDDAPARGPNPKCKHGTCFHFKFKERTRARNTYPIECFDFDSAVVYPYVLLNNTIGAKAETRLILHTYMREHWKHPKGVEQVGVNKRVELKPFGGGQYKRERVGIIYFNPTQRSIKTLVEYDTPLLKEHKYVPLTKSSESKKANDKSSESKKANAKSSESKKANAKPSESKKANVEEMMEENLCKEQLDVIFSYDTPEFYNLVASSFVDEGSSDKKNIPHVSKETYDKLRSKRAKWNKTARENMRKRAAGVYVPVCPTGAPPVKVAASDQSKSGKRRCKTPGCIKEALFRDGSGGGWCQACAPPDKKTRKNCDYPGCTTEKKSGFDGKCARHVDKTNEAYITFNKKAREAYHIKKAQGK